MKTRMRIALRHEGSLYNAYIAKVDNMKDAFLIGSIPFAPVEQNKEIKQAFIELAKLIFTHAISTAYPEVSIEKWFIEPAPERERSGNA